MVRLATLRPVTLQKNQRRQFAVRAGFLLTSLLVLVGTPKSTQAQSPTSSDTRLTADVDQRWLPWLGCWQLVEETGPRLEQTPDRAAFADNVLVCVKPGPLTASATDNAAAIQVMSIADGEELLVETLLADGVQRPVGETACTGWRTNAWSEDGARLFTRAEFECADSDTRVVSGVSLMTGTRTWLDMELVQTEGRGAVTVRRYRRASDTAVKEAGGPTLPPALRARALTAAALVGTTELGIADVIEAAIATDLPVLEAMLIETQTAFSLNSNTLLTLDDNGVPSQVIDLMVALSFPDEFVVERPAAEATTGYSAAGYSSAGFVDTWGYGGYGLSSWYPYYARPFGSYYGWSPYNSLYYLGPATHYAIIPGSPINDSRTRQGRPSSGRVYQGRGYTQTDGQPGPTARRARPRTGTTQTTAGARTSGRSRPTESSSSSSGRGNRSGGSSGRSSSGRRRAVPRP